MTLPKETQDKIKTDAIISASESLNDVQYDSSNMSTSEIAEEEHQRGYEAGATEWAGKAQQLLNALQDIASGKVLPQLIAQQALAKYKEVGNG